MRAYLLTRKGFSDTGSDACIKEWRDTQEIAKLRDMATTLEIPKPPIKVPPSSPALATITRVAESGNVSHHTPEDVTTFRWPLSKGVVAELRFVGPAKPAHLELLKAYLDVAKGAMEADAGDDQNEPPK